MPRWLACPYLGTDVELTDERQAHIAFKHDDFAPFMKRMAEVLREPEFVRRSRRDPQARLFLRWYDDLRNGKHVVVVVVSDKDLPVRHWIVTAYISQRPNGGTLEWAKR